MNEWSATIEIALDGEPAEPITDAHVDDVVDYLADRSAALSVAADRYGATFVAYGDTAVDAANEATHLFQEATVKFGFPQGRIVRVNVVDFDELEADLARPAIPELVGVAETATILGVSKTRVGELASSGRLPTPVARLAATPVWLANSVRSFAESWDRRPGRPSTA